MKCIVTGKQVLYYFTSSYDVFMNNCSHCKMRDVCVDYIDTEFYDCGVSIIFSIRVKHNNKDFVIKKDMYSPPTLYYHYYSFINNYYYNFNNIYLDTEPDNLKFEHNIDISIIKDRIIVVTTHMVVL